MTWAYRMQVAMEVVDLHAAAFDAAGVLGLSEEHGQTTAWFAAPVADLPLPGAWEDLGERDWHAEYQRLLPPVTVGALTIVPPWVQPRPADALVILPAQAFGTGHHETTTGCLAALQQLELAGRSVLDVGTGTGVLAIAAARLGAATVVALDTDPLACEAAEANARRNGASVDVRLGSLEAAPGTYDVVVANLDTATLCRLASDLVARVAAGGTFIGSGVSRERVAEPRAAFHEAGLPLTAVAGREWAVLTGRRSG